MADDAVKATIATWRGEIEGMKRAGARFVVLAAVDHLDDIEVIYLFHHEGALKEVKLMVPYEADIPSITDLFPSAGFVEREMVDLFGAKVPGAAPFLELTEGSGIVAPLRKKRPGAAAAAAPAPAPAPAPKQGVS